MKVIADNDGHTGFVSLLDAPEAATVDLSDTVVASLTADGRFIGLDTWTTG